MIGTINDNKNEVLLNLPTKDNAKTNNQRLFWLSFPLIGLFLLIYVITLIFTGGILPHLLLALSSGFIVYKNKINKNLSILGVVLIVLFLILWLFGFLFQRGPDFMGVKSEGFIFIRILVTFIFASLFYMIEKDDKYYRLITWVVCAAIMGALFSFNNIINTLSICGIFFLILYKIYTNIRKCEKISDFFKDAYGVFIVLIIVNMIVAIRMYGFMDFDWLKQIYGFTNFWSNHMYFILLTISFLFVEKKINGYYAFLCLMGAFGSFIVYKLFGRGVNTDIDFTYNYLGLAILSQVGLCLYMIKIMIKKGQGPSSEDKLEVET